MILHINGEKKELDCDTVSSLLEVLSLEKDMVAVELNKEIVHRERFDETKLAEDDSLEIVTVVGGG